MKKKFGGVCKFWAGLFDSRKPFYFFAHAGTSTQMCKTGGSKSVNKICARVEVEIRKQFTRQSVAALQ